MKKIDLKNAAKVIGGCNTTTCKSDGIIQMSDGGCYNRINCFDKNGKLVETNLQQVASSLCSEIS
ncbi:hypothetical protein [Kalamiella sp. sgz302252]|uniref:hypothetical protein n=1 Tax=Pantoea sp. sgz302252 TaxID=3341827 RepID=UPI0036D2E227